MQQNTPKPTLAINAAEKNGHLSGSGSLTVQGNTDSIMAAFTAQDNGRTQVSLQFKDDIAVSTEGELSFEGHGDLDPRSGKISAGANLTCEMDKDEALKLEAQIGQGGVSGQLSFSLNF